MMAGRRGSKLWTVQASNRPWNLGKLLDFFGSQDTAEFPEALTAFVQLVAPETGLGIPKKETLG
jgi:hypothetical protein